MAKVNLKALFIFLIVLFSYLFIVNKTIAYCPPYFAFVDKNASSYPDCLEINGGMFCGGDLEVVNNCSGQLLLGSKNILPGETKYGFKEVKWNFDSIEKNTQQWELKGNLNGKSVVVKGQTENWSNKNSFESILRTSFIRIIIVILLFVIIIPLAIILINKKK